MAKAKPKRNRKGQFMKKRNTRRNPARALLVNKRRRKPARKRPVRRRRAPVARRPRRRATTRRRASSPVIVYRTAPKRRKRVTRRRRRSNPSIKNLIGMALSAGGGFMAAEYGSTKLMQYFPTLMSYPILKPVLEFGGAFLLFKYGKKVLPLNISRAAAVGAGAAAVKTLVDMALSGSLFGGVLSSVAGAIPTVNTGQGFLMPPQGMGYLLPSEIGNMGALVEADMYDYDQMAY